jgi:tetratricopeptide (TPR) repeat protein
MEKSDMRLLQKAQKYYDQGNSRLQNPKKGLDWNDSMKYFKQALKLRESVLGRNHHLTAQSYAGLGSVYNKFGDPRAIVAYRTWYRINSFLYGKCNGPITSTFQHTLLKRGLDQFSINDIQREIIRSMQFEIEGDLLRRFGSRKAAIVAYQKATKLEETTFGRDNPDLAFLWRKIAVLYSVREGMIRSIDFGLADRMNSQQWVKGFETSLFEPVCEAIQRGDMFYEDLLFDHAVGEYVKAANISERCSEEEDESNSCPRPNSEIPKRSQRSIGYDPNIANDQRQLLRGKTNKKDGEESTCPSTIEGWEESAAEIERVQNKLYVSSQPKSESTRTISAPVEQTNEKDESSQAKIVDKTPDSTKRKPKKLKGTNGRRRAVSTIRKPSSESSLMVGSSMESTIDLGKPQSMLSLSMLSLSEPHDSCQPIETHGSLNQVANVRSRKASAPRARKSNIDSILLQSPIPMKPRSENALIDRAALNAAKHARRIKKPQSLSSLLGSLPPTPHAEANGNSATFLSNAIEEKSLWSGLTSLESTAHTSDCS